MAIKYSELQRRLERAKAEAAASDAPVFTAEQRVLLGPEEAAKAPPREPDKVAGAFVDWPTQLAKGVPSQVFSAYDDGLAPTNGLQTGPEGHPPSFYGRRTGWGALPVGARWGRRLLEWLRAPEMALRRLLFVAWVCLPPTRAQLLSPRRRAKLVMLERQPDERDLLPREPVTPEQARMLLESRRQLVQVVPVLRESIVRLIPRWLFVWLTKRALVHPIGAFNIGLSLRGAIPFRDNSGGEVVALGSSGAAATTRGVVDRGAPGVP